MHCHIFSESEIILDRNKALPCRLYVAIYSLPASYINYCKRFKDVRNYLLLTSDILSFTITYLQKQFYELKCYVKR